MNKGSFEFLKNFREFTEVRFCEFCDCGWCYKKDSKYSVCVGTKKCEYTNKKELNMNLLKQHITLTNEKFELFKNSLMDMLNYVNNNKNIFNYDEFNSILDFFSFIVKENQKFKNKIKNSKIKLLI